MVLLKKLHDGLVNWAEVVRLGGVHCVSRGDLAWQIPVVFKLWVSAISLPGLTNDKGRFYF